MKTIAWMVAAAALSLGAVAQEKSAEITPDPLTATILERIVYDKRQVCLLAGVVREATRVVFACSHEGAITPYDRDSIFELGSLSKVFAGLLLADMVRKGEVALDDPAAKYSLPGAVLPTRDGRGITLRQLVTHTASLPGMPPGILPAEFMRRSMSGDPQVLYDALARTKLEKAPGAEAAYSNLGFLWLADLLARRGGKPYDELLRMRILLPLGMNDTAARLSEAQVARRVQGHDRANQPVAPLEFPPAFSGAAGIDASMGDLLKLAEALAGRRKTPLDETLALAMSPVFVVGGASRMGYAWFLSQQANGRIVFHDGQTAGSYAAIAVNTATKTAAVVLADAPIDFEDLAVHLVDPRGPLKRLPR